MKFALAEEPFCLGKPLVARPLNQPFGFEQLRRLIRISQPQKVFEPWLHAHRVDEDTRGAEGLKKFKAAAGIAAFVSAPFIVAAFRPRRQKRPATPRERRADALHTQKYRPDRAQIAADMLIH